MTPKQMELLDRLREIIDRYIDDPELRRKLHAWVEPSKVKGILAEMDSHLMRRPYSAEDQETIKDIYFYFC